MGREIRKVPPNWEHPKETTYNALRRCSETDYKPLYDASYRERAERWMTNAIAWHNGTHEDAAEYKVNHPYFWEWDGNPPDPESYRPEWPEGTATWFQMYETVSEGTPVTPPFSTLQELEDYLVEFGDEWDQKFGNGGWNRDNAKRFCSCGSAPSFVVEHSANGVAIKEPRDL